MKNLIVTFAFTLFLAQSTLHAQTVNDARKLYYYEKYRSASELLHGILTNNPKDGLAFYWQVRTLVELKDTNGIHDLFSRVSLENPASPFIKVAKGYLLLENKDTVRARKWFQQAIGYKRKKDPAILLAIAQSNVEANDGNVYYAITLLKDAALKDKNDPEIFITIGDAYRKLLDGSNAFEAYQKALDLDKTNALVYYKMGKIFQAQNNRDMFLSYYRQAIHLDPKIAPVYYQLYYYYYSLDSILAQKNIDLYIANADSDIRIDYLLADWNYVSKNYPNAISEGKTILQAEGTKTKPRIYKLIAYSYYELNDFTNSAFFLNKYFKKDVDSNFSSSDFELMAKVTEKTDDPRKALKWRIKAINREKDISKKVEFINAIADYFQKVKNYSDEAYWLGIAYITKSIPNNVDLFKWGIANFNAKKYKTADSIFTVYQYKYPEQTFGYYWRARSNAAIDTGMQTGIAVPHYAQLITVAVKDTNDSNNRKWLIEAYSYIAAYKANTSKEYAVALGYYDKLLALDPSNIEAIEYKNILQKLLLNQADNKVNGTVAQKAKKKKTL